MPCGLWNGEGASSSSAAHHVDISTGAMLLSGVSLATGSPTSRCRRRNRTAQRLWLEPAAGHPFQPLEEDERYSWADEFEQKLAAIAVSP